MRKLHSLIAAVAAAVCFASLAACAHGSSILSVNGQPITKAELDSKLEETPKAKSVLREMIQETLIDQYARSHDV